MALRVLSLLYVVVLAAATLQLRPLSLTPDYVVVTNANARVAPPRVTAITLSSTTVTPTTQDWSVAVDMADCGANCRVVVTIYPATTVSPPGSYRDGDDWDSTQMTLPAGGAARYNTSFSQGSAGSYSAWSPLSSGFWPNGQYNLAVYARGTNNDQYSFISFAQLSALGTASVTLSGSITVPAPWVSVSYFDLSPHTLTDSGQALSVSVRIVAARGDISVVGQYIGVYCAKNSAFDYGNIYAYGNANADGWYNLTGGTLGGGWNVPWNVEDVQSGVRSCYVVVTAPYAGLPYATLSPAQLQASGFNPTLTLTGASFSSDETPPSCNFTFAAATIAAGGDVQVDGVCDEALTTSRFTVLPPTVTPPQLITGLYSYYAGINEAITINENNVGGNYRVLSVQAVDRAGNVAVYSSAPAPFFRDPLLLAYGEGGETRLAAAYAAGEFIVTGFSSDAAAVGHSVYGMLLIGISLFAIGLTVGL